MNPNEDHSITLADAAQMTANYRASNGVSHLGAAFGKQAILDILNQPNCTGLRIYNAEDNNGDPHYVLAGIGNNYDDMATGLLAEGGKPNPPFSSSPNPLNQ